MKNLLVVSVLLSLSVLLSTGAFAEDKATPEEVYDKILQAVEVLEVLGDDGLAAFNDPKGDFVWKDTYIFIINCDTLKVAAHPKKKRIGADISNNRDKNPDPSKRKNHSVMMCEASRRPQGGWVDYYWTKLGSDQPFRKISFSLQAPGTPYAVSAGIYNDEAGVNELNAQLK